MLKILIIEDEEPAVKRLVKMVREVEPDVMIVGTSDSVSGSIDWLKSNTSPDLILSDIQLADGTSFDIFKSIEPPCPVIFITAFDQYAIDAFKVNGIDYILKPLKKEALTAAINKFKKLSSHTFAPSPELKKMLEAYGAANTQYKNRFVVRYGDHIKTINTEDIAYFYTEDKVNFLTTHENRRFAIDFNLDQLETLLAPEQFFRINRQYIISIRSITEMFAYSKGRVLVKLHPASKNETVVSTERSAHFKEWLDGSL